MTPSLHPTFSKTPNGNPCSGGAQRNQSRPRSQTAFVLILLLTTLASRLLLLSSPYFADGPAHVKAISQGSFFMQPPGYFVFMCSAYLLKIAGLGPADAISALNVVLNLCGVYVFTRLCERVFPVWLGRVLSVCYAFMNVTWFSALIHSTYASMTFFGPALYYCLDHKDKRWYFWGCAVWALGMGFRPSDGAFLLPMLMLSSWAYSWKERAMGLFIATSITLAWWVPTAWHFGGVLGPLVASVRQGGSVSQKVSLLRVGITPRSLANVLRFVVAVVTSLNVLLPFALLQIITCYQDPRTRSIMAWIVPGSLFFALTYMSDATYIAFMAGGLLLLAGLFCQRLSRRAATAWLGIFLGVCSVHMLVLRPVTPSTMWRRVANSYCLEYTAWGVKDHYHRNLSELQREAGMSVEEPFNRNR
jgi:hypothetical protein